MCMQAGASRTYRSPNELRAVLEVALSAPSTRNTQPWSITQRGDELFVRGDPARAQCIADANRRELDLSLGCLLENLVCALEHGSIGVELELVPEPADAWLAARLRLVAGSGVSRGRVRFTHRVLLARHTEHGEFAPGYVDVAAARCVQDHGVDGVHLRLFAADEAREALASLVEEADRRLFANPSWKSELAERLASGEMGPPRWIGALVGLGLKHLDVGPRAATNEAARVRAAPLVGVVATRDDGFEARLRAGMALERVWLAATDSQLGLQPSSGPLELDDLRDRCSAELVGPGWTAQALFRLGRAHAGRQRRSTRRPLDEVLRVADGD